MGSMVGKCLFSTTSKYDSSDKGVLRKRDFYLLTLDCVLHAERQFQVIGEELLKSAFIGWEEVTLDNLAKWIKTTFPVDEDLGDHVPAAERF